MEPNNEIDIQDYVNLARSIAAKYRNYGVPFEDLLQESMIGLLEAKKRYDSEKGASFSTYASFWIKKSIIDSINRERADSMDALSYDDNLAHQIGDEEDACVETSDSSEKIVVPDVFPEDERQVLQLHYNDSKTFSEISKIMGISREKVRQLKQKALRRMKLFR
jgi:RNA polymerase sigma factor (sigma-70 family)